VKDAEVRLILAGALFAGMARKKLKRSWKYSRKSNGIKESVRLILFCAYRLIVSLFAIISSIIELVNPDNKATTGNWFIIFLMFFDLALIINLFNYKKWAFYIMIAENVIVIFIESLIGRTSIIGIIINIFISIGFYYLIVSKDWHKFK